MDVQLKELIEKIKSDGVKSAEESAAKILAEAESKAKTIVAEAEKKAQSLKDNGIREAELAKQSGIEAIRQSARDLVIDLKKEIEALFDSIIKNETEAALTGKGLSDAVLTVLGNWDSNKVADLKVLLPEAEAAAVKEAVKGKMAAAVEKGLEIVPFPGVDAGFKIAVKDGNIYYDFTAEGVGQMMSEYLSPSLAQIVQDTKES